MKKVEICKKTGKRKVYTQNKAKSLTDQSYQKQCDVNHIMKKWSQTGQIQHVAKKQGVYADLSKIGDLTESLENVNRANEAFMALDPKIRARFGNNPIEFVKFLSDDSNHQEAQKLGLLDIPEVENDKLDSSNNSGDLSTKGSSKEEEK